MVWQRQGIGPSENVRQLKTHLERDFESLDGLLAEVRESIRVLYNIAELNGIIVLYQWEDTQDTTTAPPAGYMKANNATLSTVTEFAVNWTDAYGRAVRVGRPDLIKVGDAFTVAASDLSGAYVYELTAPVINNEEFFRLPVIGLGGDQANFAQDDFVRFSWRPADLTGALFQGI